VYFKSARLCIDSNMRQYAVVDCVSIGTESINRSVSIGLVPIKSEHMVGGRVVYRRIM
jgi:hypothetical protein